MNFCMPGLTSVGTGNDFAGTSLGGSAVSSAIAARGAAMMGATVSAASTSLVSLFAFMSVLLHDQIDSTPT